MTARLTIGMLILLFLAPAARGQTLSVRLLAPRPFGYFVGDLIQHEAEIAVDRKLRLDPASLPKPGPRAYWLDLRSLDVREEDAGDGVRRYRIRLEYQTFHAPLETKRMEIPPFAVSLAGEDGTRVQAEIPAWPFLASPIREIIPPKGEGWTYLRPDVHPAHIAMTAEWRILAASTLAAALSFVMLAYGRAWPPFHRRPDRPFAQAARALAKTARDPVGEAEYRAALLILHRAFDAAAGRRAFAEDAVSLLQSRPAFEQLKPGVERFFAASRRVFFGSQVSEAMALTPFEEIAELGARLRAAERRGL